MTKNSGSPNAIYTQAELATFVDESPANAISFAINRNPSVVYKFIKQNYGTDFPNHAKGMETSGPTMNSMFSFLTRVYDGLTEEKQKQWLWALLYSLPTHPQVTNWTTPID